MKGSLRHLNALHAFEAAARHSSFAKAAAELNISHSVVSQHVKNLELWLDTKLFVRGGNRIDLTGDGRQLAPQIAHGLQILRDACDGMLRLTQSGVVKVSAEPAIASRWLRKRITEFGKEFPKIDVELKPAWRPPVLGDDHTDIIVHFEERIPLEGTNRARLFPIDGFPACAPQLLDRIERKDAVADFSALPLVHDNGRHIWYDWFLKHIPENEQWEVGKVYSDLSLAIDAAVDAEGVILADDIICRKEIDQGNLVKLDDRINRCTWYCIAVADDTQPNSAVAAFQNWLIAEASTDEDTDV